MGEMLLICDNGWDNIMQFVCTVSLYAVDGFVGTVRVCVCVCMYCQSVCCRRLRSYVCACTLSVFAVDGFVSTSVCVYCQSVCYRWFHRYVCACTVSLVCCRVKSFCYE